MLFIAVVKSKPLLVPGLCAALDTGVVLLELISVQCVVPVHREKNTYLRPNHVYAFVYLKLSRSLFKKQLDKTGIINDVGKHSSILESLPFNGPGNPFDV